MALPKLNTPKHELELPSTGEKVKIDSSLSCISENVIYLITPINNLILLLIKRPTVF